MKITPAFFSSSWKVVATETESNTASTATRERGALALAVAIGFDDAGQHLLLTQRNAELLVGLEDFRIDLVERGQRLLLRRRVVVIVLVVDLRIIDPRPGRLAHGQPAAIGIEPPGQHPFRLGLLGRDEPHDVLGQALGGLVGFDIGHKPVFVLVDVDAANPLDRLLYGRHSLPPLTGQGRGNGPDWVVGYGAVSVPGRDDLRLRRRFPAGFRPYIGFPRASPKPLEWSQHPHRRLNSQDLHGLRHVRASGATPMAARTCEGATFPDEQAAPEDTATPSRSKAMTAVSAFMPGTENSVVLGSRAASAPKMTAFGAMALIPASSRSRSTAIRAASAAQPSRTASAAAPKPAMPATFSVPARAPALLAAALDLRDRAAGHPA